MALDTGGRKWFNNAEGYGLSGRESGPDIFVAFLANLPEGYKLLDEGDRGSVEVDRAEKGPQADRVDRLSKIENAA